VQLVIHQAAAYGRPSWWSTGEPFFLQAYRRHERAFALLAVVTDPRGMA
jgi:hypothetical protein